MTLPETATITPLILALRDEESKFRQWYLWLEKSMPAYFFDEINRENMMLITHALMGFDLQNYFCTINLKESAIVLCLDSADADLRILESYRNYGIKNYLTFVSLNNPPFEGINKKLRIGLIYFTQAKEDLIGDYPKESLEKLKNQVKKSNQELSDEEFYKLLHKFNGRFLRTLSVEKLSLALNMFLRARTRDNCQYELWYEDEWEATGKPSLEIVLAWRNTPKYGFLYRLALTIQRHGLVMKGVSATYIDPYSKDSILVMSIALHGANGEAAWQACNIGDFLREFATVKYFATFDFIDKKLVSQGYITGLMGNLLRSMAVFIQQALVYVDKNLYTIENIDEALCYHPELTQRLVNLFHLKFHPKEHNFEDYNLSLEKLKDDIERLDTGDEEIDSRRKTVLLQGLNFIKHTLKTNLYLQNYTALAFRLDPQYLDHVPFERTEKFPEMPFGIFFIKGLHFFGFHIRFQDLARGGLRSVYPRATELVESEQKKIFAECYNLAYTQHMKNKDIPEGGAKGIIFIKPFQNLSLNLDILQREFLSAGMSQEEVDKLGEDYLSEQKTEILYQTQRSFVKELLTLVNCEVDGTLKAKQVVDYWKKPEYLYLGPDENMHDSMILWIANESKKVNYKPGSSFISSKPNAGINHKEYGVTSLGLNVYIEKLLKYHGIDPSSEPFTVKMSGGPDGDVAGNEILILNKYYPHTAKLIALTDVSGTISDPKGLDLNVLSNLFYEGKPIRHYPPALLSEGGFLLDKDFKRQDTALSIQTLMWKKKEGLVVEEWLASTDMNHLLKTHVHETIADIFIPAGGRPRALNENNIDEFLDERGQPTSKLIVEGANLYITPRCRESLEELDALIIKDSSANKTGVICSSFEVLSGLTLGDELFIKHKEALVSEILVRISECARKEADLLIRTHSETGLPLTIISNKISERINQFQNQIMSYLENVNLSKDPHDSLTSCYLDYCLTFLKENFQKKLLEEVPENHQKACIASHIAASLVYKKGLSWFPSLVDILPLALKEIST